MAVISSLEISILGALVVFLTLVALAFLIWLTGRLLKVSTASGREQPADAGLEEKQRDLAIIAAVMKQLGVEGELKITQVKLEGRK